MISICFYFPWCDETVIPHPFGVLGYMKNADYVITDTFHGCVMSMKFNKQFVALVRDSNRQKMSSLLNQFGLEGRMCEDFGHLKEKMECVKELWKLFIQWIQSQLISKLTKHVSDSLRSLSLREKNSIPTVFFFLFLTGLCKSTKRALERQRTLYPKELRCYY